MDIYIVIKTVCFIDTKILPRFVIKKFNSDNKALSVSVLKNLTSIFLFLTQNRNAQDSQYSQYYQLCSQNHQNTNTDLIQEYTVLPDPIYRHESTNNREYIYTRN